jgi:hypothetical protein
MLGGGRREDDGEWGHNTSGAAAEGSACNIIDNTDAEWIGGANRPRFLTRKLYMLMI